MMNRQFRNVMVITDLVRLALEELNDPDSWTHQSKEMLSPYLYRKEAKTVRVHMPRRAGSSTAALALYDQYRNSLLVYCTHRERDYQLHQRSWSQFADDKDVVVLPDTLASPTWKHLGMLSRGRQFDVVIFDGISRMKEEYVDELMTIFDPCTKLFVLLG